MVDAYSCLSNLTTPTLVLVGVVYVLGWIKLRRTPKVIDVRRLLEYMTGLLVLWVALASPLASLDHGLLTAHMAWHLVLMTVAAPLLLHGASAVIWLNGLPDHVSHRVLEVLRNSKARRLGRSFANPAFCWIAGTSTVIMWHIPAVFEAGMKSENWHGLEGACFLAAGLLFWWPVIAPWPSVVRWSPWSAPLYLFLATLPCDALSAFLTFCNRVVYAQYQPAYPAAALSALGDQEVAGALMWTWVTLAYLVPAAAITVRNLSPHGRATEVEVV